MKKIVFTAITAAVMFAAFTGVASAQIYYPGPISWSPSFVYQPTGIPTGQYNPIYVQPAGIPVTSPSYVPPRPWATISPSQPQGVCVTGCGGFGGGFSGFNSGFSVPNGYYPNGFAYQVRDRRVWSDGDDRVVRSRVQAGVFFPF